MQPSPPRGFESTPQAPKNTNPFQAHPKIKPFISRYCQEKNLNENILTRLSILRSKALKGVKFQSNTKQGFSAKHNRRFREILREQNSLSRLCYQFLSYRLLENLCSASKLESLSCLTFSNLNLFNQGRFYRHLKVLLKFLVSLKNLANFSVQSSFHSFGDPKILFRLLRSLLCLKKLQSFSLNGVALRPFCVNDEQIFFSSLQKMTQLRTLKLSFEGSILYDEQNIMNKLALVLPKLTHLVEIDLDFTNGQIIIQESALLKLFQSFRTISSLSDISLNFSKCFVFRRHNDEVLRNCLLCLNPSSIRNLNLGFYTNLHSESLVKIFQVFSRFTSLSVLHLNLRNCETINDKDTSQLCEALSRLISLSSLCLIFPHKAEAEVIVRNIASTLKVLKNLQQLKLKLTGEIRTSPSQFQGFFSSLRNLRSLKSFDMDFSWNQSIQDDVLEGLGEALKELTDLQALSLDFSYNKKITHIGIEGLCCGIGQRYSLSSLTFNLVDLEGRSERSMESIARIFRSLDSLWSVDLSLY